MASLGNDLAQLRQEQDLTLEEIRDQTKISLKVLKSIENDTIFTDFNENRTYIRSFVRSYAKALKIDERIIRIALDQAEAGQYQDLLQKVNPYDPEEITDEPPFTIPDEERKEYREKTEQTASQSGVTNQRETKHDPQQIKDLSGRDFAENDSIDWADVGQRFRSMNNGPKIWLIIVLVILVAGGSSYYLFYQSPASNQPSMEADSLASLEQEISSSDSLQPRMDTASGPPSSSNNQMAQSEGLSDTLQLIIYAAEGKLEPVRVKSDIFSETYPYWIEQGQAMRFNFVDSIKVRGQYGRMVLIFNGRPIPNFRSNFYNSSSEQLTIRRSYFNNNPKWSTASPDSLALDVASPDTIMNRPDFDQE